MEKVLLAIDGIRPTKKTFRYAVDLCKRVRAELNILQVIAPGEYQTVLRRMARGAKKAREYFEGSMAAAAFAEAGQPEIAGEILAEAKRNMDLLLPESEKAGVPCRLTLKAGKPGKEILRFVHKHHDVVLAIYDRTEDERVPRPGARKNRIPRGIRKNLHVPLVVVQG
ncbi:MAG: universal stress protein [Deltaproteobacteria bacterium]|nr:universal stress protein [Deltaproteobacteria bacterium]MBW1922537.1 universal stress protein [Deltaproteobacteria bacterium]MBW1948394.1 universal stress protein [Deltaproteobacteria bacterium]MBW2007097.1 universal stress protein [Deltaproteobacteria bacterium]MBW2346590.1 universal stress protein [Deltaproteobacteria bacterium]